MKDILLIPKIRIHNANALSSPYTIGFPAMTAWFGGVHALQRHLQQTEFKGVLFKRTAVVCHDIDLQTYKGSGDYVHSIIGTGNPLIPKTKKGTPQNAERPSFIEEARCHLTVSLIIECEGLGINTNDFTKSVDQIIRGHMKFAGGDILKASPGEIPETHDRASQRKLLGRLMPGHCLIERRDLMRQAMEKGQDAIDAMLEYLKVTHHCEIDEHGNITWSSNRKEKGWIVPIATGFHGISELGKAENQRDPDTPHRFAESVVTLGEFVMPFRIDKLEDMLWQYNTDPKNNLYLCQQKQPVIEL